MQRFSETIMWQTFSVQYNVWMGKKNNSKTEKSQAALN